MDEEEQEVYNKEEQEQDSLAEEKYYKQQPNKEEIEYKENNNKRDRSPSPQNNTVPLSYLIDKCIQLGMKREIAERSAPTFLQNHIEKEEKKQRSYRKENPLPSFTSSNSLEDVYYPSSHSSSSSRSTTTSQPTFYHPPRVEKINKPFYTPSSTNNYINRNPMNNTNNKPSSSFSPGLAAPPSYNPSRARSVFYFLDVLGDRFDRIQQQLLGNHPIMPVYKLMKEIREWQNNQVREALFLSEIWNATCLDEQDRELLLKRTSIKQQSNPNVIVILFQKQCELVEQLEILAEERKQLTQDINKNFPAHSKEEEQCWQSKLYQLLDILKNEKDKKQFIWSCIIYPKATQLFVQAKNILQPPLPPERYSYDEQVPELPREEKFHYRSTTSKRPY